MVTLMKHVMQGKPMSAHIWRQLEPLLQRLDVLVIDDHTYTRKIIRSTLAAIGVRNILEASDALEGLSQITLHTPDILFLDWEMPMMTGAEMIRVIRAPDRFPYPDVPIIMMSCHGERWRIEQALKLGVNEFIRKPFSGKVLMDRLASVLIKPRPIVRIGDYYGPAPRGKGAVFLEGEEILARRTPDRTRAFL